MGVSYGQFTKLNVCLCLFVAKLPNFMSAKCTTPTVCMDVCMYVYVCIFVALGKVVLPTQHLTILKMDVKYFICIINKYYQYVYEMLKFSYA